MTRESAESLVTAVRESLPEGVDYSGECFDPSWLSAFRKRLLAWYRRHHRQLPWRDTRDPYAIWISEIMLQQTQVATVIDYYHRFLSRFPTVSHLARAPEEEVLALWSGLGYYRRARQLHLAARQIQDTWGGVFPARFEDVLALPGVGRYTAGAICSFAYNQRQPILEANTIRLFSRLLQLQSTTTSRAAQQLLWTFAELILPGRSRAPVSNALLNQAVMELGSLVCTPDKPECEACPVQSLCPTFRNGLQQQIPVAKPKQSFTPLTHASVLVRDRQHWLMRCHGPEKWWTGLWDFPRIEVDFRLATKSPTTAQLRKLQTAFAEQLQMDCELGAHAHSLKHGVTRYRISLHCYEAQLVESPEAFMRDRQADQWRWLTLSEAEQHPLTSTAKKLVSRLKQRGETS